MRYGQENEATLASSFSSLYVENPSEKWAVIKSREVTKLLQRHIRHRRKINGNLNQMAKKN
jgi:hypothetical protein